MTLDPSSAEPILVQLARLDGKLDLINARVAEVRTSADRHQLDIDVLKSLTQTLQEGAAASKETAVALALALKDAKETQEATARAEITKSTQVANESDRSWIPYARVLAVVLALVALGSLYLQAKPK
jgi:cobalamin biosynthesis Mg chelatase CobN